MARQEGNYGGLEQRSGISHGREESKHSRGIQEIRSIGFDKQPGRDMCRRG